MDLQEFIKPELYVIAPVLYILGILLKNSKMVKDRLIPLLLCTASILITLVYMLGTSDDYGFKSLMGIVFTSITQGFLCAGAAVLTNQLKKQYGKNNSGNEKKDEDYVTDAKKEDE